MPEQSFQAVVRYNTDGHQKSFPFSFSITASDQLRLRLQSLDRGTETDAPPYQVVLNSGGEGGVVRFDDSHPAPSDGYQLVIYRDSQYQRHSNIEAASVGRFRAIDNEFDDIFAVLQWHRALLESSLREPYGSSDYIAPIPVASERRNRLLSFDNDGQPITTMSVASIPVGSVIFMHATTAPEGYLKADGALLLKANYANLYQAIGDTYTGRRDAANAFRLPDLRGEFIRCWSDGKHIDAERDLGSWQHGSYAKHIKIDPSTISNRYQAFLRDPNHEYNRHYYNHMIMSTNKDLSIEESRRYFGFDEPDYGQFSNLQALVSDDTFHGGQIPASNVINGGFRQGTTRPRNIALLACIKY